MAFWIIASKQYQEKYNLENFSALIPKPKEIIKNRPHQWWTKLTVGKPWCLATGSHCPPCRCYSEGVNSLVPLSPRWERRRLRDRCGARRARAQLQCTWVQAPARASCFSMTSVSCAEWEPTRASTCKTVFEEWSYEEVLQCQTSVPSITLK